MMWPWSQQSRVLWLEPNRALTTLFGGFLVVAGTGVLVATYLYQEGRWPESWPPQYVGPAGLDAAALAGTLVVLIGAILAVVSGQRWYINRIVIGMSKNPALRGLLPDWSRPMRVRTAAVVPYLRTDRVPGKLPKPRRLQPVDSQHNIIGRPPLHIAYLRLFENQPRGRTFIQGAWREFGYVYLLRSAYSVTPSEYRRLRQRGIASGFVNSPARLRATWARSVRAPAYRGYRVFKNISATSIRTWDQYGGYEPVAVLCSGHYWRQAVDELLREVDAVLLDLSGFRPSNEGTGYELQRTIDLVPIERVVFLMDAFSDEKFLRGVVQDAWTRMAPDSPNSGPHPRTAYFAATDRFVTTVQRDEKGRETQRQTRLVARRSETRRLAAWLQTWLEGMPPVRRPPPPGGDRPLQWQLPITAISVAAVVVGALGLLAPFVIPRVIDGPGPGPTPGKQLNLIAVPDLRGQPEAAALNVLGAAGFTPVVEYDATAAGASGRVVDLKPAPGTRLDVGATVTIVVARHGATLRTVPRLVGRPVDQAVEILRDRGLRVGDRSYENSSARGDVVLRSTPAAGAKVQPGRTVDLILATGSNTIPDVRRMTFTDASERLRQAGFEPTERAVEPSGDAPGTVIDQKPRGVVAEVGSTVELLVARSPVSDPPSAPVTLPPSN